MAVTIESAPDVEQPGTDLGKGWPLRQLPLLTSLHQVIEPVMRARLRRAERQQLLQQAAEGPHLQALQPGGHQRIPHRVERGGAEVPEQGGALAVMEDVMAIEIAMHDAQPMQMGGGRGDAPGHLQRRR
ncbi:hypothetical protein D3C78_1548070 [compost metagenome]